MITARSTQLLSVNETADRLACSRGHIYHLISAGALKAIEIKATGKRPKTRIRETDLEHFIDSRMASRPSPAKGTP